MRMKSLLRKIPSIPGIYALIFVIDRESTLRIGRLGVFKFSPGTYVYFGSAKGPGGLRARLARHSSREKRMHWHIDFLLASPYTKPLAAVYSPTGSFVECDLVEKALHLFSPEVLVKGFGSSDCRRGCPAHLLKGLSVNSVAEIFRSLGLTPWVLMLV